MSCWKKHWRKILTVVCVAALVVSVGMVAVSRYRAQEGHDVYEEAANQEQGVETEQAPPVLEQTPDPVPEEPEPIEEPPAPLQTVQDDAIYRILQQVDLPSLQRKNSEVLGWIYIPNASISYPVMQGQDNEFYLTRDWKGNNYIDGAIYADCRNDPGLTDFNTIIYGHNKEDEYMFSNLMNYKQQSFYDSHPYVYLKMPDGVYRYAVFSVHEVASDGYVYQLKNLDPEAFLETSVQSSLVTSSVTVTPQDRIISLSTCAGSWTDTRLVVQAKLDALVAAPES